MPMPTPLAPRPLGLLLLATLASGSAALANRPLPPRPDDPTALPRFMTPEEARLVREEPLHRLRAATPPPVGPLRSPAEFEPTAAIMMAYIGNGSWKDILDAMAARITTDGDADVLVIVPTTAGIAEVQQFMGGAGADLSRVSISVAPLNSIWIRDYGPRYAYEGEVRVIVDHTYNRPRPLDNAIPLFVSESSGRAYHQMPLVHAGGNYHIGERDEGFATRLITAENPGLTEAQVGGIFAAYHGLDTWFTNPIPATVDATQHIDMWFQPIDEWKVMISEWPFNPGSIQEIVCNAAAAEMAARGYTVYRVPARRWSGAHYTFVNSVMCNDIVLIPRYSNATIAPLNGPALAVWQQALPDKQIIQIDAQAIVGSAGVLHCIVKHVPAHLGGDHPTAFLRSPRGGETLEPGETLAIEWISDHIAPIVAADLLLSLDGGASFPTTIAGSIADSGLVEWTVPETPSGSARVRVVVRDAAGRTGTAEGGDFTIAGKVPGHPADLDGNGVVDGADLALLLSAWGTCGACPEDLTGDGLVDGADLGILLAAWGPVR